MTDDIRQLTAAVAADPSSLLFLDLAERLRTQRLYRPARTVVERGLERYPTLAAGFALLGRVHCDAGDHAAAADAWHEALRHDASHLEARKGLAYLDWRAGDIAAARAGLEALMHDRPGDAGVRLALAGLDAQSVPTADVTIHEDDAVLAEGTMLVDDAGMRLAGRLQRHGGADVSEAVAAELVGASREAARAARLLGLGAWRDAAVEAATGGLHVVPPTPDALLIAVRDRRTPPGRLAMEAEHAARESRVWLESQG